MKMLARLLKELPVRGSLSILIFYRYTAENIATHTTTARFWLFRQIAFAALPLKIPSICSQKIRKKSLRVGD